MMRRSTIQERRATTTGSKKTWGVGNEEQEKTCGKPTVMGPSAALERGDGFTDRSPPGMARSNMSLR
eukprot:3601448-Pyramimonas_sp.AAC.1